MKLKNILLEGYAWERKPGKPLPTLAEVQAEYQRNEAADAVFWQIASKKDIDLAMTKGVNYPKGLLKWADDLGIENIVNDLKKLYLLYQEDRYRLSVGLKNRITG